MCAKSNTLKAGDLIASRYEIVSCLGAGSMGYVYACYDKELAGRTIAIKVLFDDISSDKVIMARFRNEITSFYRITHPNVVRAYEYIPDGNIHAFSMEYVNGGDLANRFTEVSQLSLEEILSIFKQVATGLQAIHEAGIIHRDVKPENVLLTRDGVAKITDFGISLSPDGPRLTEDGRLMGTIPYLAPEYLGEAIADERSDIYSLGTVAYEMITNSLPFEGKNIFESMQLRMNKDPVPPEELRANCPRSLSEIVLRSLHRDPNRRYQTAEALLNDLEKVVLEPTLKLAPKEITLSIAEKSTLPTEPQGKQPAGGFGVSISSGRVSRQRMNELFDGMTPSNIQSSWPSSKYLCGVFALGFAFGTAILLINSSIV